MMELSKNYKVDYDILEENGNLAEVLDENDKVAVGAYIKRMVDSDMESRTEWMETYSSWLKLAAQVKEEKNFPWPKASNVKYPLVTLASIQFNARALPNIVNNNRPIKVAKFGMDDNMEIAARVARVEEHMNWQLLFDMEEWIDDTDRMLYVLPIAGMVHRKIYYSNRKKRPEMRLIMPQDLITNYHATDLYNCRRTEVLTLSRNQVKTMERTGEILEVKNTTPIKMEDKVKETSDEINFVHDANNEDVPFSLGECHWELDLDGDGYAEPYMITYNMQDGQLLSIYPRWSPSNVMKNDKGEIAYIEPDRHYVDYSLLPSPDSKTHGVGFGHLLGPLNESTNTLINQLIDAGTLSNLQSGFFARNVRMPGGKMRLVPGQWEQLNVAGGDLRNGIFPLPVKDPSPALFNLLSFLVQAGEKIASITDIMLGENPGQNQPASTTMAVLEQGLKVFTGIFGRIHRALGREYKMLYKINSQFHDYEKEARLLNTESIELLMNDYEDESLDIAVASDPALVTDAQKILKAQSLMEKIPLGVNPQFALKEALIAEGHHPNKIAEALQPPPPPPIPPEVELEYKKFEHEVNMDMAEAEDRSLNTQIKEMGVKAQAILDMAKAQMEGQKIDIDRFKALTDAFQSQQEAVMKQQDMRTSQVERMVNMRKSMKETEQIGKEVPAATKGKE